MHTLDTKFECPSFTTPAVVIRWTGVVTLVPTILRSACLNSRYLSQSTCSLPFLHSRAVVSPTLSGFSFSVPSFHPNKTAYSTRGKRYKCRSLPYKHLPRVIPKAGPLDGLIVLARLSSSSPSIDMCLGLCLGVCIDVCLDVCFAPHAVVPDTSLTRVAPK